MGLDEFSGQVLICKNRSLEQRFGASTVMHADGLDHLSGRVDHAISVPGRSERFRAVNLSRRERENRPLAADPFTSRGTKAEQTGFDDTDGPGVVKMRRKPHREVIRLERVKTPAGELNSGDNGCCFGV
jgi:hypothetical protein